MSVLSRLGQAAAATALTCGSVAVLAQPTSAAMSPGMLVWVVKDQAGGAYYNVTTGARFALVAATAAPTLAIAGLETADGVVLTADGDLLRPLADAADGTPTEAVVSVARTTGIGTWEDVSTGAQFTLVSVRDAIPVATEYALQLSKSAILTVNGELLQPVQAAVGANP